MRDIDTALVTRLVQRQFPQWADLPITAAEPNGWDNRTFRLGRELLVRLPTRGGDRLRLFRRWRSRLRPSHCLDVSLRAEPRSLSSRTATRCRNLGTRSRLGAVEALITFAGNLQADQAAAAKARRVIDEVLDEHVHAV